MKELYPMFGIITTVNTPFNEDLSINWADLRRTAEAALEAGVSGFLAPCFASEIDCLSEDERYRMASELVDVTREAGRGLVIPNVRGADKACIGQIRYNTRQAQACARKCVGTVFTLPSFCRSPGDTGGHKGPLP